MRRSKKHHQLWNVQLTMHTYDVDTCKLVARWLSRYIKIHEIDFTQIDAGLADLGLSNRAQNVLKQNKVTTLKQLLILLSDGISIPLLKGAGKVVASEIEKKALTFQNTYIFKDKAVYMRSQV